MIDPLCYHLLKSFDGLSDKIVHVMCATAEGHICKCCEVSGVASGVTLRPWTCSPHVMVTPCHSNVSYEKAISKVSSNVMLHPVTPFRQC